MLFRFSRCFDTHAQPAHARSSVKACGSNHAGMTCQIPFRATSVLLLVSLGPALAGPGITRVSTTASGGQANGASQFFAISANGTKVAFTSDASNLVAGDTNGKGDIFVKHMITGAVTRASTTASGRQTISANLLASISANGTKVAFMSLDSNLAGFDTNANWHVLVKDLISGSVSLISAGAYGQANRMGLEPFISADGTKVAFRSLASNLVADDTNGAVDIFVKDLPSGSVSLISTGAFGQANDWSRTPSISADGTKVAFTSNASNLVPNDLNGKSDIFVKNINSGVIVRVSSDATDGQANDDSTQPTISSDGTKVAFASRASNLVVGDTNNATDIFLAPLQNY